MANQRYGEGNEEEAMVIDRALLAQSRQRHRMRMDRRQVAP
jgi:hypothetical protein